MRSQQVADNKVFSETHSFPTKGTLFRCIKPCPKFHSSVLCTRSQGVSKGRRKDMNMHEVEITDDVLTLHTRSWTDRIQKLRWLFSRSRRRQIPLTHVVGAQVGSGGPFGRVRRRAGRYTVRRKPLPYIWRMSSTHGW